MKKGNVMSEQVPVQFEYRGKTHKVHLVRTHPSSKSWDLKVNEYRDGGWGIYHYCTLILYADDIWRMTNHKDDMLHLSDFFRDVVLGWYE